MARSSADLFLAQIVLEYLQHANSLTAGVPSAATLPKIIMDAGTLQTIPGLVIEAQEATGGTTSRRVVQVMAALIFKNRSTGSDAANDAVSLAASITRAAAAEMLDAVESRLMDRAAFSTFLAGLSTTRRDGFQILKVRRLPQPEVKREDKPTTHHTLLLAFEFHLHWARQIAA